MDTPFFQTKVECPVCGAENSFDTIRVGAYVESGRDKDFCPTGITWRFTKYTNYNPLVFFVATCESCYYSREFNEAFKSWKNDATFKTYRLKRIKQRHTDELNNDDSIIKRLGESIDIDAAPNESAIAKLLLAIYDDLLNEHPSNLDLGRMYLRIGWVYRGLTSESSTGSGERSPAITDIDSAFRRWTETYHTWIDQRRKLFSVISDSAPGAAVQCAPTQESILAHEAALRDLMNQLAERINSTLEGATGAAGGCPYGGESSLYEFLRSLKSEWPEIPLNEREALELSIEYYKRALETGKEVSAGSQQAQVCYLIGELSRRIGQFETAREYFNGALKAGQAFVQKYRNDTSRTALARRVLELAMEQSQLCREEAKAAAAGK
ncbi:MAG TPA: DUF2225 domain-containing protein [candidate division Zixibacteria bacterium]|nr:DUF2225 domain-containing protein [candidate division Zixibacteria bacterium]